MNESIESRLAATIQRAWEEGSPIAGSSPEKWAEIAAVARRRWNSFKRRNKSKEDTLANRIEDLARGMCEKFENGGVRLAGPLLEDYRGLAVQLADTLASESRFAHRDVSPGS